MTREERGEAIEYLEKYKELDKKLYQAAPFTSVSHNALVKCLRHWDTAIQALDQEQIIGHCKDCKFFEYDSVAKVDGIPLIVAHEICNKWGDGCKTKEDGYCFLFEPRESDNKEAIDGCDKVD